jgi:hypothetical protein
MESRIFLSARLQRLLAADYGNPSGELNMTRKGARFNDGESGKSTKNSHCYNSHRC